MRALLIILDGLGVGPTPDSTSYGPPAPNTLGHLFEVCPGLELPTLFSLGLEEILKGHVYDPPARRCRGSYGRMRPRSAGNDSTSGLWEMAGVITERPFATFDRFPRELVDAVEAEAKVHFLGNRTGSTTEILNTYGEEHLRTGAPILYTTASSALQIAASEEVVPRRRLYDICRIARHHADDWNICRVIARPFRETENGFELTAGRHDYAIAPPRTILNALSELGLPVEGLGKIGDIFAQSGVTLSHPTSNTEETLAVLNQLWDSPHDSLILATLPDFDTLYGHQRNPEGYARALETFDTWLGRFLDERIDPDDLIIITSDHGNDPTAPGTDHTREEVPVLLHYDHRSTPLGVRDSFTDVSATLADFFGLNHNPATRWEIGTPLLTFQRPHGFLPNR